MNIEFGLTKDRLVNTQHAPLAALSAHYQQKKVLESLKAVNVRMKTVDYSPVEKLQQVMLSILSGCEYLSEVNTGLRPDKTLAQVWQLESFSDQSNLSRTLDALTQMNIEQLRTAGTAIWHQNSRAMAHDWRGFLWLDFDLSGLPCGKQGEASTKGYFSGKKTSPDASWHGSAPRTTMKQSGQRCLKAAAIPFNAFFARRIGNGQLRPRASSSWGQR